MKRDKGFTLVELVVVVVILVIISTTTMVGISYYNSMDAKSGLDIMQTACDYTRCKTMESSGAVKMEVKPDGSYYYAKVYIDGSEVKSYKMVSSKYDFYISVDGSDTGAVQEITFCFNKSDGSLSSIEAGLTSIVLTPEQPVVIGIDSTLSKFRMSVLSGRGEVSE